MPGTQQLALLLGAAESVVAKQVCYVHAPCAGCSPALLSGVPSDAVKYWGEQVLGNNLLPQTFTDHCRVSGFASQAQSILVQLYTVAKQSVN